MNPTATSPLDLLVQSALEALGSCDIDPSLRPPAASPSATVDQIAAALLVSMGVGEISDDLDLRAVALLGAAAVAGLQRIDLEEPGQHDGATAIYALGDLLRRTARGQE